VAEGVRNLTHQRLLAKGGLAGNDRLSGKGLRRQPPSDNSAQG
jgi:hypothetical protein